MNTIESDNVQKLLKEIFFIFVSMFLFSSMALSEPDFEELEPGFEKTEINDEEFALLREFAEANDFTPRTALAFGPEEVEFYAKEAKKAHALLADIVKVGDSDKTYDVVIQVGHYPKTKGSTGGQGQVRSYLAGERINRVTEQDIAALIALGISKQLEEAGVDHIIIEARPSEFNQNLKSKIFLALHTDSSKIPCQVGPSVGYNDFSDASGMRLIAFALATALGINDVKKFMQDNYTKNLQKYYSYKYFSTELFEGLLEMSELSCPEQEDELLARSSIVSQELARAIQFALSPAELPW